MELNFSKEYAAFRDEVRTFIVENYPAEMRVPNPEIEAVKSNRHGNRDSTMVLVAYRHGLRSAELVDPRWSQVDFDSARLHVRRVKNGVPSVHPLKGDEVRAFRNLKRDAGNAEYVFVSERGSPFSTAGYAQKLLVPPYCRTDAVR
jgi:integrase